MRPLALALALAGCPRTPPTPPEALDDLHVAEVMVSPVLSAEGAWIEVGNGRQEPVDLSAAEILLDGAPLDLSSAPVLEPGDLVVLGSGPSSDVVLDGFALAATGFELRISEGGSERDRLAWDPAVWPAPVGGSLTRDPSWGAVDDPAGWCPAWTDRANDDFASPGAPNDPCFCAMTYAFDLVHATNPAASVSGEVDLVTGPGPSWDADGDGGELELRMDAGGHHIGWVFSTGVAYRGTRAPGAAAFTDQPIDVPASLGPYTGTWSGGPCR